LRTGGGWRCVAQLTSNQPNPNGVNPRLLDRVASDVVTCSIDRDDTQEQKAVDGGLMSISSRCRALTIWRSIIMTATQWRPPTRP
jgi:hypothetical protein